MKSLIENIKLSAKNFRESLVNIIDPAHISHSPKVPYMALAIRESLSYRAADLIDGAINLIEQNNIVSSVILTRALHETLSVLFYVNRKCKKAISDRDINHLDKELEKVIVGSKVIQEMPNPVHILKTIEHTAKEVMNFKEVYDALSEIAHPNWCGVAGLYCSHDNENYGRYFGNNAQQDNTTLDLVIAVLLKELDLLPKIYEEFDDFLPELISICEDETKNNNA